MKERCLNCMKEYEGGSDVCPHCGFVKGTPPKEAYHLHPGMTLAGRYVIGTTLGFGGFGITYRAWDNTLGKMLAIKEYYPNGIVNRIPGEKEVIIYSGKREKEFQVGKGRFLEEARNMARFNTHPNIVHVYDFFEENHTAYIVMEFLDGISYKEYIKTCGGKVDTDTAVGVIQAVLSALKQIHKDNIIHRDISPDNIFICADGRIKLIDFGAARFSTGEQEKTMSVILKPGYAPPEQYRTKSRQGPWTDIYAVGAVLYRSLTGTMPEESVNRQIEDKLKAPKELNPDIPDYVNNAIKRAMALDQELRFKNVDEFSAALSHEGKVLDDKEELARRKRRRNFRIGVIGAGICAAAGLCVGIYRKEASEARLSPAQVEIWLPAEEGSETVFEEMIGEYRENNPQIALTVEYIPQDEYVSRLCASLEEGSGPVLFDSTCLEGTEDCLENLAGVIPEDELGAYYLEQYGACFPESLQLPLTIELPMIYVNSMETALPESLSLPDGLEGEAGYSFSVNEDALCLYEAALEVDAAALIAEEGESGPDGTGYGAFQNREVLYYLSDTSDTSRIQEDMAGVYDRRLFGAEELGGESLGRYANLWSVNAGASDEQKEAAKRLLYYMLSQRSQIALCVKGKAGLPVNRSAMGNFESLNPDLSQVSSVIEDSRLIKTPGGR